MQEASTLAPLWPSPHRQHANGKEEGDPGERPGLRVMRRGNLERKGPSTASAWSPCPSSDSALRSFGTVRSPTSLSSPNHRLWFVYSRPPMLVQLFPPHTSLAKPHSQQTHPSYQLGINHTFHKGKRMENYKTSSLDFSDLCKIIIFC